ncbi:MAG: hypothetical protein HZA50_17770 [Planctomycetes bacterium]|nr:hypothetical protein [Planctomycetota bacterium]
MITSCPKCGRSLQLPDGAEGRQAQCPACTAVFTVTPAAAPMAAQVIAAPAGQSADPQAGSPVAHTAPAAQPGQFLQPGKLPGLNVGGLPILKLAICAGAFLMFLSFFLPWWGAAVTTRSWRDNDANRQNENTQKAGKDLDDFKAAVEGDNEFHESVLSKSQNERGLKVIEDWRREGKAGQSSASAFGWDFARGIVTFIFGLLILLVTVPQLFLRFLARWGWTALLPSAAMGLVVFILALTVWFGTPGRDFKGTYITFVQGVSIGSFLALAGSVFVTAAAAMDGIAGLLRWIRSLNQPAAAPQAKM